MPRKPVSQKRLSPQEKEQDLFLFVARGGKEENGFSWGNGIVPVSRHGWNSWHCGLVPLVAQLPRQKITPLKQQYFSPLISENEKFFNHRASFPLVSLSGDLDISPSAFWAAGCAGCQITTHFVVLGLLSSLRVSISCCALALLSRV